MTEKEARANHLAKGRGAIKNIRDFVKLEFKGRESHCKAEGLSQSFPKMV